MSEMVEVVARAIWAKRRAIAASQKIELEDWGDGHYPRANHVHEEARAAIEAMRVPSDEQRNAYYELSHRTETMVDAHWERAIDAALSESPPST